MQNKAKYVIPEVIGSILVGLVCAAFPMSSNGDPAVGVIQGNVFMSWGINTTDISKAQYVINPAGGTIIYFAQDNVIGAVPPSWSNKVRDVGNVSLGIVSFRLLNLSVVDAGRYVYKLHFNIDAGGQVLVIAGNPANVSVMEVADPFENEKYIMQCSSKSISVPPGMGLTMHYQWKNETGQNITASDRYSFSSDQSNLIINPLMRQDADIFVCEAWEHLGAVSQSGPFSLKVIYGPDPGSIRLSPNITSHELTESSSLTVNCSADCFPDCQYRWTGPSGIIVSNTCLLSFISIGRNQTGQYTCIASNFRSPNKTATAAISVTAFYGPDKGNVFLSPGNTSYQLTELSPLVVQCSATCVPQCEYQWSGPRVSQKDSLGWLSISQISRNQNGTFICTVTNPRIPGKSATANVSLIVFYGPDSNGLILSPNNTSYQLTEMSPLIVLGAATCFPQCDYQWTGPGISQNDSNRLLSVPKILRNQAGTFVCTVTNPRMPGKSATASVSVIVYYPPVLTMKATNTSKGRRMSIDCTASGVPDIYTFYKLTHMAPDVSRTIIRELEPTRVIGSAVSFTIEGTTYQDTGFYVCKASNGITHYSTGQLVMEDMVYVWIADQPVITSNTRYFDAEKGKSGQINIEFYAGFSQPYATWYIYKNGTQKILQNSSNFWMYMSNVTVEVKYYQTTVQLPGYNASLTAFDVTESQFTTYKVEINNSFPEPVFVTLELKPRVPSTSESHESSLAKIAGGISAGLLIILVIGIGLVLWKRNQHKKQTKHDNGVTRGNEERRRSQIKANSIKQDVAIGNEYEGLHFKDAEANQYLQLNGIILEENRNVNISSPESDSYEKLQPYANNDIQMYSSLRIPNTSKDFGKKYENTWIKRPDTTAEYQNQI